MGTEGLSRRDALRLAAAVGMAGVVSLYPGRRSFASADHETSLLVEETAITIDGDRFGAIAMGGSVPAPTLRWREGQEVVVQVTNRLKEPTSIHWHGLLLEGIMDGAPGFNAYSAIAPGESFTYRIRLRQSGTYWYHSHSGGQEQRGMYGAIIIDPAERDPVRADQDYVIVLSDHTADHPDHIMRKLKVSEGYYNKGKRTLGDLIGDIRRDGLAKSWADRRDWGDMRMDPTDLADVTGYRFLVNGKGIRDNWTGLFKPGQRVRLRLINASAMSIFDVAIPGLPMTIVSADGQNVLPVKVDEFRFGVGETYDVIVMPTEDRAYTLMAEPIDRSGYARATLAPRQGMAGEIPPLRPRAILTMADMGSHHGMDHGGMDHGSMDHSAMDHGEMDHGAMDHSAMNHSTMDHGSMDHAAMGHGSTPPVPANGDGPPQGWDQAGTPPGRRALTYADLKSLTKNTDTREPAHEISLRLTGIMERYIWTLNGHKFDHGGPIQVAQGDRVRLTFINTTMMAHPMHLHGMFFELENGQTDRKPRKHVVIVPPGKTVSVVLTADEPGDWPLHCHLLFHMNAGMMTRFIVTPSSATATL